MFLFMTLETYYASHRQHIIDPEIQEDLSASNDARNLAQNERIYANQELFWSNINVILFRIYTSVY